MLPAIASAWITPTILAAIPVVILLIFAVCVLRNSVTAEGDTVIVVTGPKETRYVQNAKTLVLPILEDYRTLSLAARQRTVDVEGALATWRNRVDLRIDCTVAIDPDEAMLENASQRLIGMEQDQIDATIDEIIRGQTRSVVGKHDIADIDAAPGDFSDHCRDAIAADLAALGLAIQSFEITDITTHQATTT